MQPSKIDYTDKSDSWYKYKGVKPPERTSHGVTEDGVEDLIKLAGAHTCEWIQKGPYIICNAGHLEHGKNIGVYKMLVGTGSKGEPLLEEKRTIYRK